MTDRIAVMTGATAGIGAHAVRQLTAQAGTSAIDMPLLNAGAQYPNRDQRSADGFELIFAVNHLATSDTHDPALMPLAPRTPDLPALAHPEGGGFGGGMRAYAASKLCNLLTARSLATSAMVGLD